MAREEREGVDGDGVAVDAAARGDRLDASSRDLPRRAIDALAANVAMVDATGTIRFVNARWARYSQRNGGDVRSTGPGVNYVEVCRRSGAHDVAEGILDVLQGNRLVFEHVYPCAEPGGDDRWFLLQCSRADAEAVVAHLDVTSHKRAELALADLATHDALTGLLNRRGVEAELTKAVRRAERSGRAVSAVMVDCDDFKRFNERMGHAGGDRVLRALARRFEGALRGDESLGRIGGDEFVVVMPDSSIAEARSAAERLRLIVAHPAIGLAPDDAPLTVSMAVVELDRSVGSLEDLLDRSRASLAESKRAGKNRVTVARSSGGAARHDVLGGWLDAGALAVARQPIVSTRTGEVLGIELLFRSLATERPTPLTVLRVAAERGELVAVDEALLRGSLSALARIDDAGARHVNLTPATLLGMSGSRLESIFGGTSTVAHPLVVELSEQLVPGDPAELLDAVGVLRSLGVRLGLDDVGAGRTSLEALLVIEPEVIKVDVGMVRSIEAHPERHPWMARLVRIAAACGAMVIAEGVETAAELDVVASLGIEACQGYFVGPPELLPPARRGAGLTPPAPRGGG